MTMVEGERKKHKGFQENTGIDTHEHTNTLLQLMLTSQLGQSVVKYVAR